MPAKLDLHTLKVLEFPRIKDILKTYLESEIGLSRVESLTPDVSLEKVKQGLKETSEMKEILITVGKVPLWNITKPDRTFEILRKKDSVLDVSHILYISEILRASRELKEFCGRLEQPYPHTQARVKQLFISPALEKKIRQAINSEGEILDSASIELARIRREIKKVKEEIKDILNLLIESRMPVVQEPIITVRDGRYVLPLKTGFSKSLKGIVHGESASRATLFVEPLEVLDLNNKIRGLEADEKREKLRILKRLTGEIRESFFEIEMNIDVLAEVDLISGKARYSIDSNSSEPLINTAKKIHFIQAKNPLLEWERRNSKEPTVPVDIRIGGDFHILVITGPNTGGKTISLKTLGLLSLMVQAGMHIPAKEGSETSIFQKIFADVGDEQSIQQNLSTFSSHMRQIIKIINEADSSSLVLLDELGSGTDPSEGAALGVAILDDLRKREVKTLATTHHNALKVFAHSLGDVENASVEFDSKTLKPTYCLAYGYSGKSSAFYIAENLGLSKDLIVRASQELKHEEDRTEKLIERLEYQLREVEENRRRIEREKDEALEGKKEQIGLIEELRNEKSVFRKEARMFLKEAKSEVKALLRDMKKVDTRTDERLIAERFDTWKSKIEDLERLPLEAETGFSEPKLGDRVEIRSIRQEGIIKAFRSPSMLEVQVGLKRIQVPLSDLGSPSHEQSGSDRLKKDKDINVSFKRDFVKDFSMELNVIGTRVDEAIPQVDKYLDDAKLSGLKIVRIIHGKGTGRLKKAISEMLQGHPLVKDFYSGELNEGGWGATVVEINN